MPHRFNRRTFVSFSFLTLGAATACGSDSQEVAPSSGDLSSQGTSGLESEYDAVIIGSGYGGSVVAYNLAKAYPKAKICVLERGKEYHPGDFPKNFPDFLKCLRGPLNKLGLIDANMGSAGDQDLDMVSGSGLGGTSLINAAIASRPQRNVFLQPEWPAAIRKLVCRNSQSPLGQLAPFYTRAERILGVNLDENVNQTRSSSVFGWAMRSVGLVKLGLLRLSIKFGTQPSCEHGECDQGLERSPCNFCGDCCSGCNSGSKNILPYNYLRLAEKFGCRIFSRTEVTELTKVADSCYHVQVRDTCGNLIPRLIKAKVVVLAAGTQGSTKILLTARLSGLKTSPLLGERVSLNGDVMGICYNGIARTNIAGMGQPNAPFSHPGLFPVGPSITTAVRGKEVPCSDENLSGQFTLMNCTIPSPIVNLVAKSFATHALNHKKKMNFSKDQWDRVEADHSHLPLKRKAHPDGALNHSTLFLACGHDAGKGRFILDGFGNIKVIYKDIVEQPFFSALTDQMKKASEKLGGVYFDNPRTSIFGGKMVATHPLGGCPMGDSCQTGVVNDKGQVFSDDGSLHLGLYVVDGAIIPRALGAPPSLTISALAERISELMVKDGILRN